MRFMVYFTVPDHDSELCEPVQQTIVEGADVNDAGQAFYCDGDMSGAYIKEICPLTY